MIYIVEEEVIVNSDMYINNMLMYVGDWRGSC